MLVPTTVFLTKGLGKHRKKLASFEMALRDAKIASLNLVRVSSIFPPHARLVSQEKGLGYLKQGLITYVVMSDNATNEPFRLVGASVGIAIPQNRDHYGYLSEYHSFGEYARETGACAEDLAAEMLASSLGIPFNPDTGWDERKIAFRISKNIVHTRNITQTALGDKKGLWTTVIAAAVLILQETKDESRDSKR
ncbi:MAG: pyruvoyl-dependent arginine decarboxylase [Fibrobacterota bacterium]